MSWADYGFPGKLPLATPWPILTGLTAALNERRKAVDLAAIANPAPLAPVKKDWFTGFESYRDATLALYVDHTKNNGDFTGLATIPMMTTERIFELLGEDELVYADHPLAPELWLKWIVQQYRIINLLRWTKQRLSDSAMYNKEIKKINVSNSSDNPVSSWSDAISRWNSQEWKSSTNESFPGYSGAMFLSEELSKTDSNYYCAFISVTRFVIAFDISDYPMDLYIYPQRTEGSSFGPIGNSKFNSKYNKIATAETARNFSMEWPNYDEIAVSIASSPSSALAEPTILNDYFEYYNLVNEAGSCSWGGSDITQNVVDYGQTIVLKFDSPNGFKFRGEDWQ